MKDSKIVVSALTACTTLEDVSDVFKRFEIYSDKEKTDCLNSCMGNPKTFFSCGKESITDSELYNATVQIFLTNAWKIAGFYK